MSDNNFYGSVNVPYPSPTNGGYQETQYPQGIPAYPTATPVSMPKMEPPLDQPWYGIGFGDAIKRFFQKYATFSGRASRGEYWWVFLATYLLNIVLGVINRIPYVGTIIWLIVILALFIPTISISVRRLHDTNRSGWWLALPYGFVAPGYILLAVALAPYLFDESQIYSMDENDIIALGGTLLLSSLLFLIGGIIKIIFMVLASNPEGVRFDKGPSASVLPPTAQVPAQPMYGTPAYGAPTYGTPQQPAQPTYGQPQYGQQPPAQYPYSSQQ